MKIEKAKRYLPWPTADNPDDVIYAVTGFLDHDEKDRFVDGQFICTSRVVKEEKRDGKIFVHTLNSIYETDLEGGET